MILDYKKFSCGGFFCFPSWNFLGGFVPWNMRAAFFWEKIKNLLILDYKKFSWGGFFLTFGAGAEQRTV